jgi:hypothetical protein
MRFRCIDSCIAIALLLLAAPIVLAIAEVFNEADALILCASRLRQIGIGLLLYANENKGALPRTIYDRTKPPTWGTPYESNPKLAALPPADADPFVAKASDAAPAANDVTAALFLMLRTQKIEPLALICPSTGQTAFDFGGKDNTKLNWTNWPGKAALRDHLSYSLNNPYPSLKAVESGWRWNNVMGAEAALAADMNPGVAALLKLSTASIPVELVQGNSFNHFRAGQNVLYGDSHVDFATSPFVGVD